MRASMYVYIWLVKPVVHVYVRVRTVFFACCRSQIHMYVCTAAEGMMVVTCTHEFQLAQSHAYMHAAFLD